MGQLAAQMADPACFFFGCVAPPRYTVTYREVGYRINHCCGRHLSGATEVALRRVPICEVTDFDITQFGGPESMEP
jgi:hypothetical protein